MTMASILITGTSRGIGFETALAFARKGHTVHATMRNPQGAPLLSETAARESLPVFVSAMDVDSDGSVSECISKILDSHGPIDILVNNAGIERVGSIEETPLARFREAMETNYFGVLRCTQALIPHMRQRGGGAILNVSSIAGRIASPPLAPYNASKFALEALTEALACELEPFNIRVALIEPGIIDTAMARRIGQDSETSIYPHVARFNALFSSALQNPVPPSLVATRIVEIAETEKHPLRCPVGPDAIPFLKWRASKTDEEWISINSGSTEAFFGILQRELKV